MFPSRFWVWVSRSLFMASTYGSTTPASPAPTVPADNERQAKVAVALIREGYEVDDLVRVIHPDDSTEYTEAWFTERDGSSTYAYLKPFGQGYKVVPDP